jgi:dihydrofolate reductase
MAKLIYSVIASLDGYIEGADGTFDWAAPDEEVHAFVTDLERSVGTYLYGRRMYETMVFWESPPDLAAQPPVVQDFAAIWQKADKIVYSKDAGGGEERQDPYRARVRPGGGPAAKSESGL